MIPKINIDIYNWLFNRIKQTIPWNIEQKEKLVILIYVHLNMKIWSYLLDIILNLPSTTNLIFWMN